MRVNRNRMAKGGELRVWGWKVELKTVFAPADSNRHDDDVVVTTLFFLSPCLIQSLPVQIPSPASTRVIPPRLPFHPPSRQRWPPSPTGPLPPPSSRRPWPHAELVQTFLSAISTPPSSQRAPSLPVLAPVVLPSSRSNPAGLPQPATLVLHFQTFQRLCPSFFFSLPPSTKQLNIIIAIPLVPSTSTARPSSMQPASISQVVLPLLSTWISFDSTRSLEKATMAQ